MPCFTPLKGYSAIGGGFTLKKEEAVPGLLAQVPCGKCVGCRDRRAREWALRCVHEAQLHRHNSFITLTYSPEALPNDGGLRVGDFQRFCKRLRKRVGSFRFYHCGEYGSQNLRPHYHALLFGIDFSADRVQIAERPYPKYRSAVLEETWGLGRTEIGSLTYESAAYCARYVNKAGNNIRSSDLEDPAYLRVNPDTGECWQVPREYSTMSRRPGIGAGWLDKFHQDVYPSDEVIDNGRRFPVPRYYDNRHSLTASGEAAVEEAKVVRRRNADARKEDSTPERLAVRERNAVARLRLRQREL